METKLSLRDLILQVLDGIHHTRLDLQGGYPAIIDSDTIPGYVIIADVDHDEAPDLTIYAWGTLEDWAIGILEHRAQELASAEDIEIFEALMEGFYEDSPGTLR